MKKFLVERKLPGAGKLTKAELQEISRRSVAVISSLEQPYEWIQSFVTEDSIICIHVAESKEAIRAHARDGGFPVHKIEEIIQVI
ncbi:MAG TPA: DUF4242 domain-containing protein, partial [Chitinophagaceae bacterium]